MKDFLPYLGSIIILIGVALLAYYQFGGHPSNLILGTAGILMIVGFFTHLFLNKKIVE
ncbi:MAG TPA: hypothetical protein P5157_03245 [Paludibacteraceae bacterium]|jgi:predicted PurR-regulated permease PerM|nr:hypothetical protein [Paludibacteraceae bacterium]OPZ02523.1 MAG: hypothetical protein BWZ11_00849 [Bacteroidetes bacterium ADurb.BinA395]MBP8966732.1 hypothetical protein [Paludibacteraceae bacterium]HOF98405.1 hypothetical protein [Paludibacteraceae bacterium]HOJ65483.1 hypothetical protein [Paludibacteraceae bacterium]